MADESDFAPFDSSDASTQVFGRVTVEHASGELTRILSHVCTRRGRVEIHGQGGHTCVLISKEELESLEQAMEIMANTSEVRKIADGIAALTFVAAQGPVGVSAGDDSN